MQVVRARVMGWCMGVERAVSIAHKAAHTSAAPVSTLGPLIHNPRVVAELSQAGIRSIPRETFSTSDSIQDNATVATPGSRGTIIVAAHGASPQLEAAIEKAGYAIVDATCPRVLASQKKARLLAEQGYRVIIAGDAGHAEVSGIAGQIDNAIVVANPAEARAVNCEGPMAIIAQSTITREEYSAICAQILGSHPDAKIMDTLCPCTEERLSALEDLASMVEAIIIIGGKNSANTQRLASKTAALGLPAFFVESVADISPELDKFTRIGLAAGASTPASLVDEIEHELCRTYP